MECSSQVVEYSYKQLVYLHEALHTDPRLDHRWNIKSGATQCGKTTVDYQQVIPFRIATRRELPGLVAILGVSLGTIERNVLIPMREYFSARGLGKQVSPIHKDAAGNTYVKILGQTVYLCGMMNKTAISRLRGSKFKYAYGDEVAEWNEEAFALLKSRMSLEYSCFDGACNPASDTHFLYYFIHSNIDIYLQEYTIFDNPFLSKKYVQGLCDEYAGTVYYDRYILGLWKKAEGIIFRKFADKPDDFILGSLLERIRFSHINVGVDFGGNGSSHTFVATGFTYDYNFTCILESKRIDGATTPDELEKAFIEFLKMVIQKYQPYTASRTWNVFADSAEQVLIRGFRVAVGKANLPVNVLNARKMPINDRINLLARMFGANVLFFLQSAKTAINAYSTCVWNEKQGHEDERLDDGSTDIDTCDATEYSIEPEYKNILNRLGGK